MSNTLENQHESTLKLVSEMSAHCVGYVTDTQNAFTSTIHLFGNKNIYFKMRLQFKTVVYLAQWSRQRGNLPLQGSYVLD